MALLQHVLETLVVPWCDLMKVELLSKSELQLGLEDRLVDKLMLQLFMFECHLTLDGLPKILLRKTV